MFVVVVLSVIVSALLSHGVQFLTTRINDVQIGSVESSDSCVQFKMMKAAGEEWHVFPGALQLQKL